ncbi:P-type ATPase [Phlyctema vagabunda]|uniref:P-type ATPase n=1 Tax=Phlyctema vagabunda TaxID=108571 RepID=A0ABR4P868_9HELO
MNSISLVSVPTPSQGPAIITLSAIFMGFNAFFVGLRCYTKARISKTFGFNDVGMIVVVLTYASLMALLILGVRSGIGNHTFTAGLKNLGDALKYIWFLELIYVILTSIMKASIAITLLQWAKSKVHKYLLWTAIALDTLICLIFIFYLVLQCTPVSYAWKSVDPTAKGKCVPFVGQLYMGYALCIVTISLDMLFLIVPFLMLKGRGVNSRIKLGIYAIFTLGVLASIANFIRLAALVKLKASNDPLFDAAPVFTWSTVEVSIGICVAGILELGPLMQRYRVKGFESHSSFEDIPEDQKPISLQAMNKGP